MADEISITTRLRINNGDVKLPTVGGTFTDDQTTASFVYAKQTIGTTAGGEVLVIPSDIGSAVKWLWVKNLDATNYVEVGNHNGASPIYFAKLMPGDEMTVPVTVTKDNINCLANTAAVNVLFALAEK